MRKLDHEKVSRQKKALEARISPPTPKQVHYIEQLEREVGVRLAKPKSVQDAARTIENLLTRRAGVYSPGVSGSRPVPIKGRIHD